MSGSKYPPARRHPPRCRVRSGRVPTRQSRISSNAGAPCITTGFTPTTRCPELRAKQLLHDWFVETITIQSLASAVGSNRSSLTERFAVAFGISPAEYLGRIRIRHGLRQLRASSASIDEVARTVGYQSGVKFAARVRRSIGITVTQARLLDEPQLELLLAERVALHHPQPSG